MSKKLRDTVEWAEVDERLDTIEAGGGGGGSGTVLTTASFAALRAADRGALTTAVISSVTGGLFRWTSDTTSADDNGTIVVPSATPRTGAWKRASDGAVNVRWFGATGDGSTDDRAAIQAVIDVFTASTLTVPLGGVGARTIYFPNGTYMISSALVIKSGHQLIGEGQSAVIKATSGFSDTALVKIAGSTGVSSGYAQQFMVRDLGFHDASKNIYAVKVNDGVAAINAKIENLQFNTGYGLDLGGYAQGCEVTRLFSYGACNQIIAIAGNHNRVSWIDKESGTGTDAVPYAHFKPHSDSSQSGELFIEGILIEGTGNAAKVPIRIESFDAVVIVNCWCENTPTNGHAIEIVGCGVVKFLNQPTHVFSPSKLYIRTTTLVDLDTFAISSEDVSLSSVVDIDDVSQLRIGTLYTRRNGDLLPIVQSKNISIDRSFTQTAVATGHLAVAQDVKDRGQENFLQNGSFEAGSYGWQFVGTVSSSAFVQSRFGRGLMARYQFNTGAAQIYQVVAIPAELVGRRFAFRIAINMDAPAYATAITNGAGVSNDSSNYLAHGGIPQVLTSTFIPTAAGNISIGVYVVGMTANTTNVELDNAVLSCGSETMATFSAPSMDLGGQTIVVSATVPTSGTWKVGDRVYYTTPTAAGHVGAVCVTAGTPGTWSEFGRQISLGTGASDACAGNDARLSDDRVASGIRTATTVVSASGSAAPSAGQVLVATGPTGVTWQTLSGDGIASSGYSASDIIKATVVQPNGAIALEWPRYIGRDAVSYATTPPATPSLYDMHMVLTGATGAWNGWGGSLALCTDTVGPVWQRIQVPTGTYCKVGNGIYVCSGTTWTTLIAASNPANGISVIAQSSGQYLLQGTNGPRFDFEFAESEVSVTKRRLSLRAGSIAAALSGSYGWASAVTGASRVFSVQKNGSAVGTVTIASGAQVATLAAASATTIAIGDRVELVSPAALDAGVTYYFAINSTTT